MFKMNGFEWWWILIVSMIMGSSIAYATKIDGKADVALIMPSMYCTETEPPEVKSQLRKIADHFEMGQAKIRIGVVHTDYIYVTPNPILLNLTESEKKFRDFMDAWQCKWSDKPYSYHHVAFEAIRNRLFNECDGRPKFVVMFMRDYAKNRPAEAKEEAAKLRETGARIYVVLPLLNRAAEWSDAENYAGGDRTRVADSTWKEMVDVGFTKLKTKIASELPGIKPICTTTATSTSTTTTAVIEATISDTDSTTTTAVIETESAPIPTSTASNSSSSTSDHKAVKEDEEGFPTWAYGVIAAFVLLLICVIVFVIIRKKKKKPRPQSQIEPPTMGSEKKSMKSSRPTSAEREEAMSTIGKEASVAADLMSNAGSINPRLMKVKAQSSPAVKTSSIQMVKEVKSTKSMPNKPPPVGKVMKQPVSEVKTTKSAIVSSKKETTKVVGKK